MPYQKTFIQGYNAQIAVDSKYQVIVATELTNVPTDDDQLPHMVQILPQKPEVLSADAGYASPKNLAYLKKQKGIDAYVACGREKHRSSTDGMPIAAPRGRRPKGLTLKEQMRRKVRTKKGRALYARRKAIAEPPIGQIKRAMGFREFSLRGYVKCRAEWFLVTASHNLRRLFAACCERPERRLVLAI
jgi:hypothetical protein